MYFARTMLVLDFIEARSEAFWLKLTPFFFLENTSAPAANGSYCIRIAGICFNLFVHL